ncbi:MAG: four-carbon acid sugar kinase family protein [Acidimicrobiia bacterium]
MLVAADDRTGALETAGAIADRIGRTVRMVVHGTAELSGLGDDVIVVDLGSRHLTAPDAALRSAQCPTTRPAGHKIDSMLRGNWAAEVLVRSARVLVVPALPAARRVCRGGVVFDGDVPVALGAAGRDARDAIRSSRPADHLRGAGAIEVDELPDAGALEQWLAGSGPCAVMDASSDDDLEAIAHLWSACAEVLLAGTSAMLGAGAAAVLGSSSVPQPPLPLPAPVLPAPLLLVCGSLHEGARTEIAALAADGVAVGTLGDRAELPRAVRDALAAGRPAVLTTEVPRQLPVSSRDAEALASLLAAAANTVAVGTLIVIGGDSAAMILGDAERWVGGLLAPGTPWCPPTVDTPMIVTRAGGLGSAMTLRDLVLGRMES